MTVNKTRQPFRLSAAPSGEASGESRGRRVLAAAPSRRAGSHAAGDVARADRDVSRAAASLQPAAEQRRHVPRRLRPRRSEARRRRRSRRASTRDRCTAFRGARRTSSRSRAIKTTWGSAPFKDQVLDYDASVVEQLRDAGAVLIAKVTTGELAGGDNWFGGQTKSPWDPTQGSSGSSAGPSSATAAGCIAFGIGTETSGSILSPAARCGLAGTASDVRPHQPLRRDGAVVDAGSARPDLPLRRRHRDRDAGDRQARRPRHERHATCRSTGTRSFDIKKLKVGIIQDSFDEHHQRVGEGERREDAADVPVARRHAVHSDHGAGRSRRAPAASASSAPPTSTSTRAPAA